MLKYVPNLSSHQYLVMLLLQSYAPEWRHNTYIPYEPLD
jgi:hypothetical protein